MPRLPLLTALLLLLPAWPAHAEPAPGLDVAQAREALHDAEAACQADAGRLWGVSLCGPVLLVHPGTREVVASRADAEGRLTREGDVFVGRLPPGVGLANTAMEWAGVRWAMGLWPLPEDAVQRRALLLHEAWHRVQAELGLPAADPACGHLDTLEGRVWLQLEWRALLRALEGHGEARRQAVRDALLFRAQRRSQLPGAAQAEDALERSEGLAEYTGVRLSGAAGPERLLVQAAARVAGEESLVRSFAYVSGPLYGVLLDALARDGAGAAWRGEVRRGAGLGALLQRASAVRLPRDVSREAARAAERYAGKALRAAETERDRTRSEELAGLRARLVDGPVLVLGLERMQMQFDPRAVRSLGLQGTVYRRLRVADVWGALTAEAGALLDPGFQHVAVPAPSDAAARPLAGEGWTLELAPGWHLVPGARPGDLVLAQEH